VDDIEIICCADGDEWDRWLVEHGESRPAVWLTIAKKGSGAVAMTAAESGDVAICHGWIDGQRRSLDATHFLQRYSPRRPGSPWSRVNVERVAALEAAGRMRPAGRAQVAAAVADGRWAAAYAPQRAAPYPTTWPRLWRATTALARRTRSSTAATGTRCSCRYSKRARRRAGPGRCGGRWRYWKHQVDDLRAAMIATPSRNAITRRRSVRLTCRRRALPPVGISGPRQMPYPPSCAACGHRGTGHNGPRGRTWPG
jgi:uncharacterized protein YdeI (YjbR/CyaY-like superfamily)